MTPAAYPARALVLSTEGGPDAPVIPVLIDRATLLSDVLPELREAVQTRSHVLLAACDATTLAPIERALLALTQENTTTH